MPEWVGRFEDLEDGGVRHSNAGRGGIRHGNPGDCGLRHSDDSRIVSEKLER